MWPSGVCCIQSRTCSLVSNTFIVLSYINFCSNIIYISTFCLVDKELSCIVVSVYNLAQGRGPIIGDSVAIPEPYLTKIDATFKNQVCSLSFLTY